VSVGPDIKAAALADLHAGDTPQIVAERYRLNPATVRSWKLREVQATALQARATEHATTIATQRERIGDLVIDLLRAKLEASQAIAKAAQNTAWIDRQSAADLAEFGDWLDRSAFAIGDRLAGRSQPADDPAGE
jgi:hypothetical protein